MARQYVITEKEMTALLDSLELAALRNDNVCDPSRHMDDAWRQLSDKEKQNMQPAVESLHRGFHFVVTRWAQSVGFTGLRS
jgi:hypothetical protein